MRTLLCWLRHFFQPLPGARLNLGRRSLLLTGGAGVGATLLGRVGPLGEARTFEPELIRPPGSVAEAEFLSKCIRCGECMKV
ncbi:MAG TPA: hypothetical protein VG672_29030, partial [Bryobacteraceae bacterium]|nr:hypothetical protein [Bryobacteraceae bacterium]